MQNPYFSDPRNMQNQRKQQGMYDEFDATELYCPNCRRSMPVRKRLLLVLPEGEKFEYLCDYCGTSVGTKTATENDQLRIVI